jgi:uncharacterized OB-fold protein
MTTPLAIRGLTTTVDGVEHLVGVRCRSCGTYAFPVQSGCPRCGGEPEPVALPRRGTVWSWTVQRIRPKPPYEGPEEFDPFAVGYVDLGPLLVEARLAGKPVDAWRIGEPVELAPGDPNDAGERWSFRFVGAAS